jgi:dTDP-4-amino-4,6-dideoxygalactose transaminase
MIPVAKVAFGEEECEAVQRPLRSGWVTQGPEVAAFEREFAAAVGAPCACAMSSCTTALHVALLAVGVRPGDEVITVSHSFIATANAVRYCGATPVFVDIEPDTFNMDARLIEEAITERTRAIMPVHQMGLPCNLPAILGIARRHGLPVIEDAACASGSEILWDGRFERIGRPHGDVACFSFHPRKILTTGDGGMITTSNAEIDRRARLLRQHGMSVSDSVRHASARVVFESYDEPGYNYRMTDIQAAVGRVQVTRLDGLVRRRRELAQRYAALLQEIPGVRAAFEPEYARHNFQSYCVRLPAGCDQRAVMQSMLEQGVATRRGVMCAHREGAYPRETWGCVGRRVGGCDCAPRSCARLPESERAQDETIIIPLYHDMTAEEQAFVANALRRAVARVDGPAARP